MKTFSELKPGDTLYEHIGGHIIHHTVIKATDMETAYNSHEIVYTYQDLGAEIKTLLLGDETSVFPFYTSIDEIRKMTEVLTYYLEKEEVTSC